LRITQAGTLSTITAVDTTPTSFQRSRGDDLILDSNRKDIERPRRWWTQHVAGYVEGRGVTGADEAVLTGHPGDRTPEVGALAVEGEKGAIGEPGKIELAFWKRGHRTPLETIDRTGHDDRTGLGAGRPAPARSEEIADDPHRLGQRHPPQQQPHPSEESPP
jgi:hypothetical protein